MQINSQPLEGWDNNNGETCLSGQKVKVAKGAQESLLN